MLWCSGWRALGEELVSGGWDCAIDAAAAEAASWAVLSRLTAAAAAAA